MLSRTMARIAIVVRPGMVKWAKCALASATSATAVMKAMAEIGPRQRPVTPSLLTEISASRPDHPG